MKIYLFTTIFCFTVFTCIAQESNQTKNPSQDIQIKNYHFKYNLQQVDSKYFLPNILNEVSGLSVIDTSKIACVQDEIGTIYIYDYKKQVIIQRYKFDSVGDFEGLTQTDQSIFILRSDGRLTEWTDFNWKKGGNKIIHRNLALLTSDNEGLCFDSKENRLLIAGKNKPYRQDQKWERLIYSFNLTSKKLNAQPAYSLNLFALEKAAKKFNIIQNEKTSKGKLKPFNFRPSSLSVHPLSSEIYILSAADFMLVILNRNGEILYIEKLNPKLFPKAEGISFDEYGTMIISNEAVGSPATLLCFKIKK